MHHPRSRCTVDAAYQGGHARLEFPQVEQLRHVIVGARIEPEHAVFQRVARSEHQYRRLHAAVAEPPQHREPVEPGQRDVEHDQVVRRRCERVVGRLAVADEVHRIGRLVQRPRERGGQHGVVFNDQDAHALVSACQGVAGQSGPMRRSDAALSSFAYRPAARRLTSAALCYIPGPMDTTLQHRPLSTQDLEAILDVTKALAAPFDLMTMLGEVVAAAKQVLRAERGSVWLYDEAKGELVLEVATGIKPVRVPWQSGLVGACARSRRIINVPDCYADPRFDPHVDKASGYRTRCMLTLPLVDHKDVLVGVMQVLNKAGGGVFDSHDEALATALAAQCAVALQRVRMTEAVIEGEKMRQELEMARVVQMSTLPASMPALPGYDVYGTFKPADLTGGDTFDLAALDQGLLVVLGDATGHGIAPALSVSQMQAMLRMAFRLGADLETAFREVNNQLADTLASDRFITAFVGMLDADAHLLHFHSGGQGPILHFQAALGSCARYKPTSFPLGAMRLSALKPMVTLPMRPGDILLVLSDGIYEYHDAGGDQFGEARVEEIVRSHHGASMEQLSATLLDAVQAFAAGAPQEDDITVVLVKRESAPAGIHRSFERSFDSIEAIFAFTSD